MKRLFSLFLVFYLLSVFSLSAFSSVKTEQREYLEDGSYIEEYFAEEKESEPAGFFAKLMEFFRKLIEFFTGRKTVTKTKYINYYSLEGELLWSARLRADFIYSKKEAVCTECEFDADIFDSDWKIISSECEKSENKATANFKMQQYKLAVPLKTIEKTLILTCDNNGNVS
ncbi:MAG: hypothetical protein IKL10_05640 [Clostridia bacterium]|nr:hypothetical protein [Clostridia bacterium]